MNLDIRHLTTIQDPFLRAIESTIGIESPARETSGPTARDSREIVLRQGWHRVSNAFN